MAASGSAHHQPAAAFSATPSRTAAASAPSTRVTRLGGEHRVAKAVPGGALGRRQREHGGHRERQPGDADRGGPGVVGGEQGAGALDGDVERQQGEGRGDDAQGATIAPIAGGALELPDDHGGRDDLDHRVDAEPGQRERPDGRSGREQDHAADDVPGQGRVFQAQAPPQEPLPRHRRVCGT
jgi:hypothetical protein